MARDIDGDFFFLVLTKI